ncbi:MAGa7180 family putative nuclease [[Mycoplasma] gypis]|uniref:YqaJ-like viral recombinase domain n=1 Tax=[Mycoplasma] gypis TaxID=92404 RepID=A0ABZ2RT02_9BACT|nr:hypothetical protein [[Mycoplasma] gypis]MBN0919057.1 hypothetical protein [[Mycoplasma] gypis]
MIIEQILKNKFKRTVFNGIHYTLDEEQKRVYLAKEYHQKLLSKEPGDFGAFKKIGGSTAGKVLETDIFNNQFQAFCHISRLSLPMLDSKYVDAGVALEPKIINKLATEAHVDIQTFDVKKYNYDFFKGKNKYIGGIPDGYIESKNMIIEIKTVGEKKKDAWEASGPNLSYIKQAQLYSYLIGADFWGIFAIFLREEDYQKPENLDVNTRFSYKFIQKLDKKQAKDDLDKIEQWFKEYSESGISPQYNPVVDSDLIAYLKCQNEEQWLQLLMKWYEEKKVVLYEKDLL